MYNLFNYGEMINDLIRMDAYSKALKSTIKPNSIVLDIGSGTGIFALLACQLGAKKVYAFEPDCIVSLAREIAAVNHFSDRIEFVQGISTNLSLPEKTDVIVSDLRGILPLFKNHLPSIIDARNRFLSPDGILIPKQDSLWASVVNSSKLYQNYTNPWGSNHFKLNLKSAQKMAANLWCKGRVKKENLLSKPQCWALINYRKIKTPHIKGKVIFKAIKTETAHGFITWFDTILTSHIGFTNQPGKPELIYGQAFFPLPEPVRLSTGDSISVKFKANLMGNDYIWQWETQIRSHKNKGRIKAEFKQSTFYGKPLTLESIRTHENGYIPSLTMEGELDRLIMNCVDGKKTIDQIAKDIMDTFPGRFKNQKNALERINKIIKHYA